MTQGLAVIRQLTVIVSATLFIGACAQGSPTSPSALAVGLSVSTHAITTPGTAVSGATASGAFLPADEPAAAGPVAGCGGCDPMNQSLIASLICETKRQIRELEDRIQFLDQQIPVVKVAIARKRIEVNTAALKIALWDAMQKSFLAGEGPDPQKEMGDRADFLEVWREHVGNLKFLEDLLADYEAARQSAPKAIEALRQYLALLEKDLFEFCHDQPASLRTTP